MKKFLAAVAASVLVLTLSACGSGGASVDRGELQATLGLEKDAADCIADRFESELSGDEVEKLNSGEVDAELEAKFQDLLISADTDCDAGLGLAALAEG